MSPTLERGLGNGTAVDVNLDGIKDLVFSSDISTTRSEVTTPVFIFNRKDNNFSLSSLTIDSIAGSFPRVYFGMYVVSQDINRDGIPDFIVVDQSERYKDPVLKEYGGFVGAEQFAYISEQVGVYKKVSLSPDNLCVHGWGVVESADGVFRFLMNVPWSDNTSKGIATVISAFNANDNTFTPQNYRRTDDYHAVNGAAGFTDYFYQSALDINNDGNTDVVSFASMGGKSAIYWNDGQGGFRFLKELKIGLKDGVVVEEVAIGDFNGDGFQDIVVMAVNRSANPSSLYKTIRVLINEDGKDLVDRTDTWLKGAFQDIDSSYGYLDIFDFNQDGRSDFIFNHFASEVWSPGVPNLVDVFVSDGKSFQLHTISGNQVDPRTIPISDTTFVDSRNEWTVMVSDGPAKTSVEDLAGSQYPVLFSELGPVISFVQRSSDQVEVRFASYGLLLEEGNFRLSLGDSLLAAPQDPVATEAYRLYKAAFNRTPDPEGLGYWIAQMDGGMDLIEVSARFIDSSEFRAQYGYAPSDADFLTRVYTNVLGRTPDKGGFDWWLNAMSTDPSKTKAKVLADFSESPENKDGTAEVVAVGIEFAPWSG